MKRKRVTIKLPPLNKEEIFVGYPLMCGNCYKPIKKEEMWIIISTEGGLLAARHAKNCKCKSFDDYFKKDENKKKIWKSKSVKKLPKETKEWRSTILKNGKKSIKEFFEGVKRWIQNML